MYSAIVGRPLTIGIVGDRKSLPVYCHQSFFIAQLSIIAHTCTYKCPPKVRCVCACGDQLARLAYLRHLMLQDDWESDLGGVDWGVVQRVGCCDVFSRVGRISEHQAVARVHCQPMKDKRKEERQEVREL